MTRRALLLLAAGVLSLARVDGVFALELPGSRAESDRVVRQLDGEEFLEDQPIWVCSAPFGHYRLVGVDASGQAVRRDLSIRVNWKSAVVRGFEFGQSFEFRDPGGRYPLVGPAGGIPQGRWEIRSSLGDTMRALARFRVVAPPGSERSVRDGLARASRLARQYAGGSERAADLYDAIYRRYPRTAYLSVLYWGQWEVREHTRFANDPGRWLEEIFAHFHDSCFGVFALDRFVSDMGVEAARPTLKRLVGIYPDTPLSRAALRYL